VTIDLGTGDGRAVLAIAGREPGTLVLGLDANAAAMAEASRRAAGPTRKGGLPNARFIVAAAELVPPVLRGTAGRVMVTLPWGSLLRGCLGADDAVADGIAGLVAPGGSLELLLAPSPRDGLDGLPLETNTIADAVAATFAGFEMDLTVAREAIDAEITASVSTWARRLRSQRPADRTVMLVRLVRSAADDAASPAGHMKAVPA
jgi:16S rRNA (adenine(1408)-N(1))-methyltransferase